MRVTVIHNPTSGFEQLSRDELLDKLREHGLEPVYESSKSANFAKALEDPGELVIVAGGDGTVGKVAKHLLGSAVPIRLYPLGTANNVASTLTSYGHHGKRDLARGVQNPRSYDAGLASTSRGELKFIESAGTGLFAHLIRAIKSEEKKARRSASDRHAKLRQALMTLSERLLGHRAQDYKVTLDGKDYSGRYLFVEVMNIRSIGPNVELAPQADPGDGSFDVVFLAEHDRQILAAYLEQRMEGAAAALQLGAHRARHITIASENGMEAHVDDEVISFHSSRAFDLHLKSGVLTFV